MSMLKMDIFGSAGRPKDDQLPHSVSETDGTIRFEPPAEEAIDGWGGLSNKVTKQLQDFA